MSGTIIRRLLAAGLALAAAAPVAAQTGPAGTVRYYHADALGSVRAVTDAQGNVVARHDYFAFGEEPAGTPDPAKPRFTGQERDPETGMDYFGARYYMQRPGRFTTVDPVLGIELASTNPQRWNRYAYAGNNPLRFVDPDGADFWDFVNGVSDAMRANFAVSIGRPTGGNADFVAGQRVGNLISLAGSAVETLGGFGTVSGGVAACGTGLGCFIGAPAIAGGAVLATHGVGMGVAASVSLMSDATDGERGSGGPSSGGLSRADARKQATELGFKETKDFSFNSHGKPVYQKGDTYITLDRDMHKGGIWKMFDRRGNRLGTYNADLSQKIGQ